jgi:hypothetical protein
MVKGILQYNRSSRIKEPTVINAIADDYLRLAYHGLRTKDKSSTAALKKDFAATIGNTNIILQDIGRIILNLIAIAFYVLMNKRNNYNQGMNQVFEYVPKRVMAILKFILLISATEFLVRNWIKYFNFFFYKNGREGNRIRLKHEL